MINTKVSKKHFYRISHGESIIILVFCEVNNLIRNFTMANFLTMRIACELKFIKPVFSNIGA